MKIIYSLSEFKDFSNSEEFKNKSVGFVPTMGALHEGHLSLVEKAKSMTDVLVVSIFVNPNQFNDPSDLRNYPRNTQKDLEKLSPFNPDVVFIPEVKDIYPKPDSRIFDFGKIEKTMEGAKRPGHFNGVAQVVSRLFDIVKPDKAFFGQKDFQQLTIIKSLVKQLNYPIEIIPCPIIREANGLAMSSRNELLSSENRAQASALFKVLKEAKSLFPETDIEIIREKAINSLNKMPFLELDYFEIVDSEKLVPVNKWNEKISLTACLAIKINDIRLIDNLIFI